MLDFNDAGPQADFSPMPLNTMVPLIGKLRPGGVGPEGALTQSRNSDAQYLDFEFTVTKGAFKGRKLWQIFVVSGGKLNEQGQSIAAGITRATIRAILNSSAGVRPDDDSDRARQARAISGFNDLGGKEFAAKLGIEKGNDQYQDKNKIALVIEPDHKDYAAIMAGTYENPAAPASAPAFAGGGSAPARQQPAAPAPSWSQPNSPAQTPAQAAPPLHVQHQPPAQAAGQPDGQAQAPQPAQQGGNGLPGWAG